MGGDGVTEIHRCLCEESLKPGLKVAYHCDPNDQGKFIICFGKQIHFQPCSPGMSWNHDEKACSPTRKCPPTPPRCASLGSSTSQVGNPASPNSPAKHWGSHSSQWSAEPGLKSKEDCIITRAGGEIYSMAPFTNLFNRIWSCVVAIETLW